MTKLDNIETHTYKGITITLQRRWLSDHRCDWGYRTSTGIAGIAQSSANAAKLAAMKAIDLWEKDDG